jgi:hypothetical protein
MKLNLDFSGEVDHRLVQSAAQVGKDVATSVRHLATEHLGEGANASPRLSHDAFMRRSAELSQCIRSRTE